MSESFLHGVEVLEINTGSRPIQTVRSAVVGIIGTAPDSEAATPATLTLSPTVENGAIVITGPANETGNLFSVRVVKPDAAGAQLAVAINTKAVTVSLATDDSKTATTTATQLVAALNANEDFAGALTAALPSGSSGAGIVKPSQTQFLAGGKPEAFPLGVPTLVAGSMAEAARLGTAGTLPDALDLIFQQAGAVVIVVRVAEGADSAATAANVAAANDALIQAESVVGFAPRILIAPGFSHQMAVATALVTAAERLRAVVVADGPNTNDADAIAYAGNFGSDRLFIVDPGVKVLDDNGDTVILSASAVAAGLIVKVDNEVGFWASPSNTAINGIIGTARPIDFAMGDTASRANLLNEQRVATIIRQNGFRLWGNRSTAADPKFSFLCVRRTADIIQDSILRAHLWAVDKGITPNYLADVSESVNAYLRDLKAKGAIAGGACWPNADLNTPANIAAGKVYFDFDFSPSYPAERVVFRSIITNKYLADLTA